MRRRQSFHGLLCQPATQAPEAAVLVSTVTVLAPSLSSLTENSGLQANRDGGGVGMKYPHCFDAIALWPRGLVSFQKAMPA